MNIQEQINNWSEEIVAEFRPFLRGLSDQARNDFVADKLALRFGAAVNDPEFKKQYICQRAEQIWTEWTESRQPQGKYDPKGVFPLDDGETYKLMSFASREDLVTWRAILAADPDKGCNLANMLYIDSRLELWRDQKNLAELEKELQDCDT